MSSTPPATVILDSGAVTALSDVHHPKHRALLPYLEGAAQRRARKPSQRILVPVAVRIEAGWDCTDPAAAVANRVSGARDVPLTGEAADKAARIAAATGVSVVDATVGEAAGAAPKPVVILSSDVEDMGKLAERLSGDIRLVRV